MSELFKTFLYLIVGAAFLGVAWVARPAAPQREAVEDRGELFFPEFDDPLTAASLEILEFDEETGTAAAFSVARHDGVWSLPSHEYYPADAENQFAEATAQMIGLIKGSNVSDRPADHELYGVLDPTTAGPGATGVGKRVTISDEAERPLADLILGREVKDSPDQRYVRLPGLDRVYLCPIDPAKFSTTFEDWIEKDLLELTLSDIDEILVNDYSIDEFSGRVIQGDVLRLRYDSDEAAWRLEGLSEGEELDSAKLNEMRRALDDLAIVDVHRKPAGLSAELKTLESLQLDTEAVDSLRNRGYYIVQNRLLSNQGETIVRTKQGVQYSLRFGEIALTPGGSDEDGETGGTGRYVFITAEFNPDILPPPDILELPEMSLAQTGEGEGEAEEDAALAEALEAARAKIAQENEAKQAEYDKKVEDGRTLAADLNARFADWYYVISDPVYQKIRVRRDDVVKPAEPAEEVDPTS